jgi:hypothetical protein
MCCHSLGHSSRGSETHVCAPPNGECVYAFVASALSITLFFMSPNKSHILAATIAARTLPSSWNTATSQFPSTTSLPRKTTRPFHLRRCSGFSVSESFSNHICNTIPMCILVSFCFDQVLSPCIDKTESIPLLPQRSLRTWPTSDFVFENRTCDAAIPWHGAVFPAFGRLHVICAMRL